MTKTFRKRLILSGNSYQYGNSIEFQEISGNGRKHKEMRKEMSANFRKCVPFSLFKSPKLGFSGQSDQNHLF